MINDTTSTKEANAAKEKTGGGWMGRLVRLTQDAAYGVQMVGILFWIIFCFLGLLPLFFFTCRDWNETFGEWHTRTFGKSFRDHFILPNMPLTGSKQPEKGPA
jgi:hypothetical protein